MQVVQVRERKPDIQITLSHREASVLRVILYYVGGDPDGPRGVSDELSNCLGRVGIGLVEDLIAGEACSFYLADRWPNGL